MKRSVTVVIPARYGSSRFPGKPLVELLGKPMIQHVYEQAQACRTVDDVLVATDDERIKTAVQRFGGQVVMMTEPYRTGTDRVAAVADSRTGDCFVDLQETRSCSIPISSPTWSSRFWPARPRWAP